MNGYLKEKHESKIEQIGEEMNRQDNRGTQFPLYVVQETKAVPTSNDDSEYSIIISGDGDEMDESDLCEDCEYLEARKKACVGCGFLHRVDVKEIKVFELNAGVFFTAKACEEHIEANKHHYSKPKSYAISAWRNWEMQEVMKHLSSQAGTIAPFYQ